MNGAHGTTEAVPRAASVHFRLPQQVTGWLLMLPALVLLLALTLYPVLYGVWLSFFNKHSFFPEQTWIGLGNYRYIVSVWQFFPFVVIGVLARLQTIPQELYDAAMVDGAGAVRRFLHITLPQLMSVLFVIVLLRSIWMFTKFDTPWLMIQGGGAEPYIRTLPIYTYQRTFAYYEAGRGSAMAVIMFLILVVAAALYFHFWRREEQL